MAEGQSSFLRRAVRRSLAASGITAAILYGWWQAVENARAPHSLPKTELGTPLALGRVALTPLALHLRPASPSATDGRPLLVLSAKVENVTGETQAAPFGYPPRLVTVETDRLAFETPEIILLRDRQPLRQLQPRIAEEVEIIWKTPANWQAEDLSFTYFQQQFKLKDNLYGRSSWLGYSAVASMVMTPETAQ